MVRWKAVKTEDESSCFADEEYKKFYPKGAVVEASPDTLGIFVFKNKKSAISFLQSPVGSTLKIKRVNSIGKGRYPKLPAKLGKFKQFYSIRNKKDFFTKDPYNSYYIPNGTLCYSKVLVLD